MTEKRCTDCRYTKGIGYDFWCGEGHTEYEVFGAETNCPYYEYHDWSKGTPSKTEKRFELIPMDNSHKFFYGLFDNDKNEYVTKDMKLSYAEVICNLLNELNDKNKQLKSELISKEDLIQQLKIKLNMDYYNKWKKCNLKYTEICEELLEENKLYKKLSDENEQLKQRNDNQYNQLKQLWELIEKGDWETLTAMDKKMKEDEERLQKEWKCYK